MLFDFAKLSTKDRYKLLSFTVVPRPIAWVVTVSADGQRRNAAPFSFFNIASTDPPLVMLGITASGMRRKDTAQHIGETGEFVVNLVDEASVQAMNITAIEFDASVDELQAARLEVLPSLHVRPPRIAQSPVALECERYQMFDFDSGQSVVLGRVLAVHVDDRAVLDAERCYIDTLKLGLVGRMDARYLHTETVFEVPRISTEQWRLQGGAVNGA